MHKDTMRFRKIPFEICAALLSALYLTFLVDTYTLNTVSKRVFVFCYFLVMCLTAVFLRRKLTKGKAQRKGALAAAGILAALIIVLGHSVFFPSAKETTVSLSALPCEDESYHEVWFTSLQVDGQEAQLSNLEVDAIQGWIYDRGGDDYVYYPGEDNGENYLTFKVTGQAVNLYFGQNAWSGIVNIWVDGTAGDTLLLTSEDNSSVDYTVNAVRHYAAWEYILYGLGAWAVIWFFTLCVFESAIDALSYLTLLKQRGRDWRKANTLSLGGVGKEDRQLPPALSRYLKAVPHIMTGSFGICGRTA